MKRTITIVLFLIFIVAGCATMKKLEIQFNRKTPIAIVGEEINVNNIKLAEIFKSSLTEELLKKGFIVVDDSDKDVVVIKYRIKWSYVFPLNGAVRAWIKLYYNGKLLTRVDDTAVLTGLLLNSEQAIKRGIVPFLVRNIENKIFTRD